MSLALTVIRLDVPIQFSVTVPLVPPPVMPAPAVTPSISPLPPPAAHSGAVSPEFMVSTSPADPFASFVKAVLPDA